MTTTPTNPRVSVLLPGYNAGSYLDAAVRSILEQSLEDLELVVIDDGSTDGSGEVLRKHAQVDSRVRLISRENRGLVATLGELIDNARGELLARMDADDIALPDRFRAQVRFLEENPRTVCIGGGIILIDENAKELNQKPNVVGKDHVQRRELEGRMPICHPAAMFRASAIAKVGGYRPEAYPSEDLDLWLRLGEVGHLDNVPEAVLRYRVHSTSISVQQSDRQIAKMRDACEAAWKRRNITDGIFRGAGQQQSHAASAVEPKPGNAQAGQHNPTAQSLILASNGTPRRD